MIALLDEVACWCILIAVKQKKPSVAGGQMNMVCGFSWMTLPMNEVPQAGSVTNEGFKSPRTGSRCHS